MDSSYPNSMRSSGLWPGLWVPLVILIAGLTATATTAHLESSRARDLAEAHYHAQHQALVNLLLARATSRTGSNVPAQPSTQDWLQSVFNDALPPNMGVRVDTLARHTKRPILQIRSEGSIDPTLTLRTEIRSGDFSWMLTTVPARSLLEGAAGQATRNVWLAGGLLSAIASALALLLCRRLQRQTLKIRELEHRETGADQQITNLQVEKTILRQALDDSERRSRDLVALSGGIIGELDEAACIGFVSPQLAELLERAPADQAGLPFEQLIESSARENFRRALAATRAEQSTERIDLPLLHRDGETTVDVALRIRALQDPVHGLIGYRLSALPHTGL